MNYIEILVTSLLVLNSLADYIFQIQNGEPTKNFLKVVKAKAEIATERDRRDQLKGEARCLIKYNVKRNFSNLVRNYRIKTILYAVFDFTGLVILFIANFNTDNELWSRIPTYWSRPLSKTFPPTGNCEYAQCGPGGEASVRVLRCTIHTNEILMYIIPLLVASHIAMSIIGCFQGIIVFRSTSNSCPLTKKCESHCNKRSLLDMWEYPGLNVAERIHDTFREEEIAIFLVLSREVSGEAFPIILREYLKEKEVEAAVNEFQFDDDLD